MKRSLLIALAVLLAAGSAYAFGGSLIITQNTAGTNCALLQGASTMNWHISHKDHTGSTGVAYSVPVPNCANVKWFVDASAYLVLPADTNGSQTGVSVAYGQCFTAQVLAMTITYQKLSDTSPNCCPITVKGHQLLNPSSAISSDCAPVPNTELVAGGTGIIRKTGDLIAVCPCSIAAEPSTWGVIKELFSRDV